MKKVLFIGLAVVLALTLTFSAATAGKGKGKGKGNNGLSGPHWGFNIIGHPKNVDAINGDHSNGRAIMVPLKNAKGPNEIVCEDDGYILKEDEKATWTDQEPAGAKIHFLPGDDFRVIDRDATDKNGATIQIPTVMQDGEQVSAVNVYLRVLGKPMTCMDIDAYALDLDQGLWFWSGSVDLNRKKGKSAWVNVDELFDVFFCEVDLLDADLDGNTNECLTDEAEVSVFNNVFEDYFWNILNNGTRLVQVRLYPR